MELNVGGTEHVIAACAGAGVQRLVYTSSNNVVLGEPVEGANGRTPYPPRFADPLQRAALWSAFEALVAQRASAAP